MHSKNLLFILALFVLSVLFAGSASSASDCSDNIYALTHPECSSSCSNNNYALTHPLECSSESLGCNDNNYALNHPIECGIQSDNNCGNNNYALTHPLECGAAPTNCDDNNYALTHPLECGANPCSDNVYALTHPECSCTDNVYALTHPSECASQCDEKLLDSYRCSGNARQREKITADCVTKQWLTVETCAYGCDPASATCRPVPVCTPGERRWGSLPKTLPSSLCRSDWTAITDCNQYGQWVFIDCVSPYGDTCTPSTSCSVLGCGKTDSCGNSCGACPAPAVVDNAPTATINVPSPAAPSSQLSIQVTGNDDKDVAQLLLYDASNNLLETLNCDGIQTSCSKTFTRTAPSAFSASYTFKARSKDSAGQFSSAFVSGTGTTTAAAPGLADNPPAAAINVPASAVPSSNIAIVVSGTDDNDVAQLLLYDSGNVQIGAPFDCVGVQASCSNTFTVAAPSAFSTAYTFKARSKDSANQLSGFVSGSGTTTAAPVVPSVIPPVVPPVIPPVPPPAPELALPKPLQVISVKFPLQPLFLRALNFPDSDCVRPGESALLAVKVQNTAKAALKDLKFTATVPELGVRVSGGPAKLKANGKLTQLLRLDIPEDAEESTYYLRFSISNNKFSRAVHRTFIVDSSC